MTVPIIAFFNNKGGVGKTSLVYHLAWMYAEQGLRVVAADLDPQANLSVAFLDEERLEVVWEEGASSNVTIFDCLRPLMTGEGDVRDPHVEKSRELLVNEPPGLIVGDLRLSRFEDQLAEAWNKALGGNPRAFRVLSAFWRLMQRAAEQESAVVVLVDLGPNLGAINRAALIASDFIVVPLSPDLFSLQGLKNLGPALRGWRRDWQTRILQNPETSLPLPAGRMQPAGYVVLQHSVRLDRPVKAYEKWIGRIPSIYADEVAGEPLAHSLSIGNDPSCLAVLKHYRSLMPMAQESGKPMFLLKPADGAIGSHLEAVRRVREDFAGLAHRVLERAGVQSPAGVLAPG